MKITLITVILIWSTMAIGQAPKFGKVDKENLLQSSCSFDSLAKAEYIYHGCKVDFEYRESTGFQMVYYYHDRIKIYSDDALQLADFSIASYSGKNTANESVSDLKGYTFNMEGNEISKTKLEKSNVYKEEVNKSVDVTKFAMPAVKAGSIIDVRYTFRSSRIFAIEKFYFQFDIPVRKAHYEVEYPEYFNYNFNFNGLAQLSEDKKSGTGKARLSYTVDSPRSTRKITKYENLNYQTSIKILSGEEIAAVVEEPYVYTMSNYMSSVSGELRSTQFPYSSLKFYTKTWNDIATLLDDSNEFGAQLDKKYKAMNDLVQSVSDMDTISKIVNLYNYVQQSYSRKGANSIYTDDGIGKMIKTGSGNLAEINLLLVNLLRRAGIAAYPLVSRASSSGFLNLTTPSITDLNYVKVLVLHNEQAIYLDASDKYNTINVLPYNSLGIKGIIIDGDQGKALDFKNPNKAKRSRIFDLELMDNTLLGSYTSVSKGYAAYQDRYQYATGKNAQNSVAKDETINYTNVDIQNLSANTEDLKVTADAEVQSAVQAFDGKLFVDINIANTDFTNPFKSKVRNYPLFLPSKINSTDMIKVKIPEGYTVESVPEDLILTTPDGLMKMSVTISQLGEAITILVREYTTTDIIPPQYYEAVKQMHNQIEAKLKEKIILSKI